MRVVWAPIYTNIRLEGDVININVIDNKEHFLLALDDCTFRSVAAEECLLIKPETIDTKKNA